MSGKAEESAPFNPGGGGPAPYSGGVAPYSDAGEGAGVGGAVDEYGAVSGAAVGLPGSGVNPYQVVTVAP